MTVSDSLVTDVRLKTAYLYPQNKRFLWLFTASGNLLTIRIKSCPVNCLLLVLIVCLMVCSSKFTFIKTTFYQVWGQLQYYSWSSVCFTGSVLAFMIVLNWIESNHLRHISQQIICQVQFQSRFLAFSNQSCVYFALYARVIACIYTRAEKYTVLLIVSRNILTKMDDKIYNL